MGKKEKKAGKRLPRSANAHLNMSKVAETDAARDHLSFLGKLNDWHRRSDNTHWVLGEYLEG